MWKHTHKWCELSDLVCLPKFDDDEVFLFYLATNSWKSVCEKSTTHFVMKICVKIVQLTLQFKCILLKSRKFVGTWNQEWVCALLFLICAQNISLIVCEFGLANFGFWSANDRPKHTKTVTVTAREEKNMYRFRNFIINFWIATNKCRICISIIYLKL